MSQQHKAITIHSYALVWQKPIICRTTSPLPPPFVCAKREIFRYIWQRCSASKASFWVWW